MVKVRRTTEGSHGERRKMDKRKKPVKRTKEETKRFENRTKEGGEFRGGGG